MVHSYTCFSHYGAMSCTRVHQCYWLARLAPLVCPLHISEPCQLIADAGGITTIYRWGFWSYLHAQYVTKNYDHANNHDIVNSAHICMWFGLLDVVCNGNTPAADWLRRIVVSLLCTNLEANLKELHCYRVVTCSVYGYWLTYWI